MNTVFIVVVINMIKQDMCEVYIPDLRVKQYGEDRVEAIADTIQLVAALKAYCHNKGINFNPTATAESAAQYVKTKDGFVTVLCIE